MKQVMVLMLVLGLGVTAGAQGKIRTGHISPVSPRPRVIVVAPSYGYGLGYGYRYSPFYNPYTSFYSPFNDPFYRGRVVEKVPSELKLEIEEIENNYSYQISTVRHDKSVDGKERRQKIRDLKHQKEIAVINAKRTFWNVQREDSQKNDK